MANTVVTGPAVDSAGQPANGYLYVEQWYRSEINGTLITDNPAKGIVKDGELYLDDGVTPLEIPPSPIGGGTRIIEDFRPFTRQVVRNVIIPANGPVQYATLPDVIAPIGSSTFIIPGVLRSFVEKADGVGDALVEALEIKADMQAAADGFDDTVAAAAAVIDAKAAEIDGLVATNDGVMAAVAADPDSDFAGALSATIGTAQAKGWARTPEVMFSGTVTHDGAGAPTAANVIWPDGASGVYAADTISSLFPPAVDAYHVTRVTTAGTQTFTQPLVTRDAYGNVVNQPDLVVA